MEEKLEGLLEEDDDGDKSFALKENEKEQAEKANTITAEEAEGNEQPSRYGRWLAISSLLIGVLGFAALLCRSQWISLMSGISGICFAYISKLLGDRSIIRAAGALVSIVLFLLSLIFFISVIKGVSAIWFAL